MIGAVLSIFTSRAAVAVLPARSVTVPLMVCPAASADCVIGAGHVTTPDSVSLQVKVTTTGPGCHPALLATGVAAAKMAGADLSMFSVTLACNVRLGWSVNDPVIT